MSELDRGAATHKSRETCPTSGTLGRRRGPPAASTGRLHRERRCGVGRGDRAVRARPGTDDEPVRRRGHGNRTGAAPVSRSHRGVGHGQRGRMAVGRPSWRRPRGRDPFDSTTALAAPAAVPQTRRPPIEARDSAGGRSPPAAARHHGLHPRPDRRGTAYPCTPTGCGARGILAAAVETSFPRKEQP